MTETPRWLEFHDRVAWRAWLRWHHTLDGAVWVLINKEATPPPGLYYEEAVEEALCWGWIDSTLNAVDDRTYALRFSPRRDTSVWSESNKARVARLIEAGLMMPPGLAAIRAAKASGQWAAASERDDATGDRTTGKS